MLIVILFPVGHWSGVSCMNHDYHFFIKINPHFLSKVYKITHLVKKIWQVLYVWWWFIEDFYIEFSLYKINCDWYMVFMRTQIVVMKTDSSYSLNLNSLLLGCSFLRSSQYCSCSVYWQVIRSWVCSIGNSLNWSLFFSSLPTKSCSEVSKGV